MDYTVISRIQNGEFEQEPGESEQQYMERMLYALLGDNPDPDFDNISDRMDAKAVGCSAEEQWVCLEFQPKEWMLNSNRNLHGGIIATAMDMTMGIMARWAHQRRFLVTAQMSVSYMRAIPENTAYRVKARIAKSGQRAAFIEAELTLADSGKLAATATGLFM